MAADTTDRPDVTPLDLGDLQNVDDTTSTGAAAGILVKGAGASAEWTLIAPTAQANIATADGSDLATTQALANATKAAFNTLLATLRTRQILS